MLTVRESTQEVADHPITPLTRLPLLYDPEHLYPYTSYSETAAEPVPRRMRLLHLENDALRVLVAPELGGRIWSLFDKRVGREVLFHNPVVKPTRILPVWAYISGGVEFNFPIAHSPTSVHTVGSALGRTGDYAWVRVGEREVRSGMEWAVEIGLRAGLPMVIQRTFLRNATDCAHPWMYWSNCAVRSTVETEFVYPTGEVLVHGDRLETGRWPDVGLNRESHIRRMVGVFWTGGEGRSFGAFHHDLGLGLLHVAEPREVPGKKLWSYGVGRHRRWGELTGDDGRSYAEIQSGPLLDQSRKPMFAPGSQRRFTEYWVPVHRRGDMDDPPVPAVELPEVDDPFLGYGHSPWQVEWERFAAGDGPLPASAVPPGLELDRPLRRAVDRGNRAAREPLAVFLAARNQPEEARAALGEPGAPAEWRLLGLVLWKGLGRPREAVACLRRGPLVDPVACTELDQLYEQLGLTAERAALLANAPPHRRIVERRAQLALATRRPSDALALLDSVSWPLEHQRYVRTRIWQAARQMMGEPAEPVPESLGEDDLAPFGAYWSE